MAEFKGVVTRDITARLAGASHGTLAKMGGAERYGRVLETANSGRLTGTTETC